MFNFDNEIFSFFKKTGSFLLDTFGIVGSIAIVLLLLFLNNYLSRKE